VSDICYYAYHLYVREGPQPPLFYGGKLFQQFVVDAWANYEQENSTGLGHISTLSDQSSTRDYRMLLYIINMIVKMLDL